MAKTYELEFRGYRVEEKWSSLPSVSGIYCVYAARRSRSTGDLTAPRLLYIGEAKDIGRRVPEDPEKRWDVWKAELKSRELLCVSYAPIERRPDRKRAEAALIYQHQPPCNEEHKDSFRFDRTTIRTSGQSAKLERQFTVSRVD